MHTRILMVFGILALNSFAATQASEQKQIRYRMREIEQVASANPKCLPGYESDIGLWSANDFGIAVGSQNCYVDANTTARQWRAIAWSAFSGTYSLPFSGPDKTDSYAVEINQWGSIVGTEENFGTQAFSSNVLRWTLNGGVEAIQQTPEQCKSQFDEEFAIDLNDVGTTLVLTTQFYQPWNTCVPIWALRRRSGDLILIPELRGPGGGVNNHDIVVGTTDTDAIKRNADGTIVTLYSGTQSSPAMAYKINDNNEAIGAVAKDVAFENNFCGTSMTPVTWDKSNTMRYLSMPSGVAYGQPNAINGHGVIVGYVGGSRRGCTYVSDDNQHAVLWKGGNVYDLNNLVSTGTVTLIEAAAINDRGQIFAIGIDSTEKKVLCPFQVWDQVTNQTVVDSSHRCNNKHAYLLDPVL